jgi:hypothetical protein
MPVTLFLVRTPNHPFSDGSMLGRFGKLLAVTGPSVTAASLVEDGGTNSPDTVPIVPGETRAISLQSDGGAITEVMRYTTIERMGGYVQLRPNCGSFKTKKEGAYEVTVERGNSVVKHLYQGKDQHQNWTGEEVHDGSCLRIHGAISRPERGILIHEAPHVGWLIGCISPRNLNNFERRLVSRPRTNESFAAMTELFRLIGRERANFFVLDW